MKQFYRGPTCSILYAFLECYVYICPTRVVNITKTQQNLHRLIDIYFLYIKAQPDPNGLINGKTRAVLRCPQVIFFTHFWLAMHYILVLGCNINVLFQTLLQ